MGTRTSSNVPGRRANLAANIAGRRANLAASTAARFGSAALWGALYLGIVACGEDKTESADAGTTGKNKCIAPGIGGQCMCGPGRNGTNTCGEDGYWTDCLCVSLPDGALCHEGEALMCTNTCPGETKPRMTRCVNGKYDCTCPDAGTGSTIKRDAGVYDSMRIGIDLGGTKIELIALDGSQVRTQCRIATPAHDYRAIVEAIAQLVEQTERDLGTRCSVGVGMPGAISQKSHAIKNANTRVLNGQALDRDLSSRLGRDVRVQNDANCFALSEAVDGAARDAHVVFGVILGTGTGGGIVVGKRCLIGCNAIAGEWGHNPLPWPGAHDEPQPACYCGARACLETYLSGAGLQRDHQQHTGQLLSALEIGQQAQHEAGAAASVERYCERLARGLASVINVVDPDAIVLGGGLSLLPQLYERVPVLWRGRVFSDAIETRLVPALHGDSSGVRGAAWLWPEA